MNYLANTLSALAKEVAEVEHIHILAQLNEFISRGLIVVQKGCPTFTLDELTGTINYSNTVELLLKDQDYIKQLEEENRTLKAKFVAIEEALKDIL